MIAAYGNPHDKENKISLSEGPFHARSPGNQKGASDKEI